MAEFNEAKMEKFAKVDRLIGKMVKDLGKRNPKLTRRDVLELVYNSEVENDSGMLQEYKRL